MLLTLVGTLGEVAIVPKHIAGWNIARAVGLIPVDADIGADWVALCLRSNHAQHFIRTRATTTVQATFNLRDVGQIPIPLPPKTEREAIVHILGSLDDKIELNRQMNRTLEKMAQAIFKSWFIDFDPVRAKTEGRDPGLPKEIAALFPASFEDCELGEIPKGWEVIRFGEAADVSWGDTNVTKRAYVDSGFLAFSAKGPDGLLPYFDFDRTGVVVSAIGANAGHTWLAQDKWSCIKNTIRFWSTNHNLPTIFLYHATLGKQAHPD